MAEKVQFGTNVLPETAATIERLTKAEGVTKGEVIDLAVAHYDKVPIVTEDALELPDDASVVIAIPRDKDMLVDAIGNLIASCKAYIHADDIWKGFVWARHEFQKGLPEFKSAEKMRAELDERRASAGRALNYTKKGDSLK